MLAGGNCLTGMIGAGTIKLELNLPPVLSTGHISLHFSFISLFSVIELLDSKAFVPVFPCLFLCWMVRRCC